MADTSSFGSSESGAAPHVRLGRVRWTICAMLFTATSINYMDRQVIAILKPTLEHSIGLTEAEYGYIVDAFQLAYAIGLLTAGRMIDKLGTRIGYMLVMAVWSLSAMAHALASTVLGFGSRALLSDSARPAIFPPRSRRLQSGFPRANAHWRPAFSTPERTSERFWLRSSCRGSRCAMAGTWPFLLPESSACLWIPWWFRQYRRPTDHPTLTADELRHIYRDAAVETGPSAPWGRLLRCRQTWAFAIAKFFTDPIWYFYLFWLPSYFSAKFNLRSFASGASAHCCV